MNFPFDLEELTTATVGAVGIHYDLPHEIAHIRKQSPEVAEEMYAELTEILVAGNTNLSIGAQQLRNHRDRAGEQAGPMLDLVTALAASLAAASLYLYLQQEAELEELPMNELIMSGAQIEEMLSPPLLEALRASCEPQVWQDLEDSKNPGR